MNIKCSCPECAGVLTVAEEHLGKRGTCNRCGSHVLLVDTRIPCPQCGTPVFFSEKTPGGRVECLGCGSTVVLTVQTGLLRTKLVPMTQRELDRIEADKEKRKKEELERAERLREAARLQREEQTRKANEPIACPLCGCTQITPVPKGFSFGRAAVGGLLLGPLGGLAGGIGSKKIQIACLKCGHRWDAG